MLNKFILLSETNYLGVETAFRIVMVAGIYMAICFLRLTSGTITQAGITMQ